MTDQQRNENIEDLDVTHEQAEDVKGGAFDAFNVAAKHSPALKLDVGGIKLDPSSLQKKATIG